MRPRSFLVLPGLNRARRDLLREYNVELIEGKGEAFASFLELNCAAEIRTGLLRRSEKRSATAGLVGRVSDLLAQAKNEKSDFLLGEEPSWNDIITNRAILRSSDGTLLALAEGLIAKSSHEILAIVGTAASGKSTSAKRLAQTLSAAGRDCIWVQCSDELSLHDVGQVVQHAGANQVVFLEDGDRFGSELSSVCNSSQAALVVTTLRSSRVDRCLNPKRMNVATTEFVVPLLSDSDIEGLLAVLERDNLLGALKGMSHASRTAALEDKAGRQLVVAMMEATSGQKFETKIVDEWEQLDEVSRQAYALVCISHSFRHSLTTDELLLAIGDSSEVSNEALNLIRRLITRRLLIQNGETLEIRSRHRFFAETLRDELASSGRLHSLLGSLAFVISTKVNPSGSRNSREWRFMRDLLNHDTLLRLCKNIEEARSVFEAVADVLKWNYQYYLQAGSLEVEAGQIRRAENLLEQAYSMEPSEPPVQTEYAYMLLVKAVNSPDDPSSAAVVDRAFTLLRAQIASRGKIDVYPYHVLGSQGLTWSRRGLIGTPARLELISELLAITAQGVLNHPQNNVLKRLEFDLKKEKLELSIL